MKNKILLISLILVLFSIGKVKSQYLTNYNLYMQNSYLYNPAFTIDNAMLSAYLNSHIQWVGFDGAPRVNTFGIHGPITKTSGVGLSVVNNTNGLISNFNLNLSYAYRAKFSETHYLQFGAAAGFMNDKMTSANQYTDITDDVLTSDAYTGTSVSAGAGLAYVFKGFEAQFIMPQLYQRNELNLYSIGILAYDYKINSKWSVKPSVLARGVQTSPLQFDGNLMGMWNETVWLQGGYRSNNSIIAGAGVNIKGLGIGYAYQMNNSVISNAASGTHEVQLVFNFGENLLKGKPKSAVTGTVFSSANNTAVAAQIEITDEKGNVKRLSSNETTGEFALNLKPGKTYTIAVNADEYYPVKQSFTIDEEMTEKTLQYYLVPLKTEINGYLSTKYTNKAVQKAKIIVMANGVKVDELQSDNSGKFKLNLPSDKKYTFISSAENHLESSVEINVEKKKIKQDVSLKIEPLVNINGTVTDKKSDKLLDNCIINIKRGNELVKRVETNGNYDIYLEKGVEYIFEFEAPAYLLKKEKINLKKNKYLIVKNVKLQKIASNLEFGNIEFKTGTSELTEISFATLDQLIAVMNDNADIKIEISGHTDNSGSAQLNKEISLERANSCVTYLISKGADSKRVIAVGHGESKPLVPNTTDENKAKNRRVEFKIID